MISELLSLIVAFITGMGIAALFFFILWRSIHKLNAKENYLPGLLGGMLLRHAIVLVAFAAIIYTFGWTALISALLGFMLLRTFIIHRINSEKAVNHFYMQKSP